MQGDSKDRPVDDVDKDGRKPKIGRMIKPKMDMSKALCMMGFTSAQSLNKCNGNDVLIALNSALTQRMELLEKKKRIAIEKKKKKSKKDKTPNPELDKVREEFITLHEAYQFLSRKYRSYLERREGTKNLDAKIQINNSEQDENVLITLNDDDGLDIDNIDDGDFDPALYEIIGGRGERELFIDFESDGKDNETKIKTNEENKITGGTGEVVIDCSALQVDITDDKIRKEEKYSF